MYACSNHKEGACAHNGEHGAIRLHAMVKIQAALTPTQAKGKSAKAQPLVVSKRGSLKARKTTVTQPLSIAADSGTLDLLGDSAAALTHETPSGSAEKSVVMTTDWLEAKATTIGYERTLLEKIVGFLDRVLVAIEQFVLKLWGWLGFGRKTR